MGKNEEELLYRAWCLELALNHGLSGEKAIKAAELYYKYIKGGE